MNPDSAVFIRAVKGPIMLITIGTLFALDNFTVLSFHRTWPVLVIVVGLFSLAGKTSRVDGRYRAQWAPPAPPPPMPPPPSNPMGNPTGTAQPGSYRGSTYEAVPRADQAPQADPAATQPHDAPAPEGHDAHEGGPRQ